MFSSRFSALIFFAVVIYYPTEVGTMEAVRKALTESHVSAAQFGSNVPPPTEKPRRVEFVLQPQVINRNTEDRPYWGSPSVVELRSGRLLLSLLGGTKSDPSLPPRFFASDDRGKTFSQIDSFPHRMQLPVGPSTLLRLADNRIALAMHRVHPTGHGGGLPAISFTSDEGKTWSKPFVVGAPEEEGSWYTMNDRMLQTRSGRLIIAVAAGEGNFEGDKNAGLCFFSDNGGGSWERSTRAARSSEQHGMQEPCVVERKDGSLLMLAHTRQGSLYRSLSTDGGLTWGASRPTTLVSAASPLNLRRMPDGRLLVFYNHAKPIGNKYFPRRPLVIALSDDDGETWGHPWVVDDQTDRSFVYPSITFLKEGILSLYHRQLETEAHKRGEWGVNPQDVWKYGGGTRVLFKYP